MRKFEILCVLCSCHHELETARLNGLLGNIDANTGDPQTGIAYLYFLLNLFVLNQSKNEIYNMVVLSLSQDGIQINFSQILQRQLWLCSL